VTPYACYLSKSATINQSEGEDMLRVGAEMARPCTSAVPQEMKFNEITLTSEAKHDSNLAARASFGST